MSTGGGTTTQTTVQNSAPWGPAQPYLTDLMGQAQNLYDASSQDTSYAPFNTVAPLSDQTQAALNATYQRAMGGSPLMSDADQSLAGLMQPQMAPGTAALQALSGGYYDPGNAYAQAGAGDNPYAGAVAGQMNNPYATPAMAYLGNEASTASINPYLNQMYQAASQPVIDSVNAMFGQAGRAGSAANQQELTRNLGDLAANIYGSNYNQAVQNQLAAAGQVQNAYDAAAGRNLTGATTLAGLGEDQLSRNLTAGGQLSANALNQANMMSGAAGALNNQFNTGNQLMLNAAQLAPTLASNDYTDLQNALSVGSAYDQQAQNQINDALTRWQYQQQQPWNLLDNYSGILTGLGGLGGTTNGTTMTKTPGQSLIPNLLTGGVSLLAAPATAGGSLFANLLHI